MRLFFVVFLVFFTIFVKYPAYADDIFTIKNIKAQAEAENAKDAKDAALKEGEANAFAQLLKRITPDFTEHLWPKLEAEQISDLVQAMNIQEEKITSKRYFATVDISFNQALTEQLLQKSGLSYTVAKSPYTLLLPITIIDNKPIIWGEENIFRKAWVKPLAQTSYANFLIPEGDATDLSFVNEMQIMQGQFTDMTNLNNLKNKYRCKNIIIVKAYPNKKEEKLSIDIEKIQFSENNDVSTNTTKLYGETAEDNISTIMEHAAALIIAESENQWKNKQEDIRQAKEEITLTIYIENLEQWNAVYKQIAEFDFIDGVVINNINIDSVLLSLQFQDGYENLEKNLASKGLFIEKTADNLILKKNDLNKSLEENTGYELYNDGTQYEYQR
jgi:hypothetical protein